MRSLLALAAAAALSVSLQGQAPAPATPPVVVDHCGFNPWSFTFATASIEVSYHVTGSTPVDDVGFAVRWADGNLSIVHDVGRFAPDARVKHYLNFTYGPFGPQAGPATYAAVEVAIDSVRLDNGTAFDAPYGGVDAVRCEIYRGAGGHGP